MNVLHLCSYYIGNKLYKNLFLELDKLRLQQSVYIPIRDKSLINRNFVKTDGIELYYDLILKKYHRFFYGRKIRKQKEKVKKEIPHIETFNLIHAHSLFSDGGTAYLLSKEYGINYLVSVRNTDLNVFYKYAVHLRPFIHIVLKNASKIVFISHAYKKRFFEILPKSVIASIENKVIILPNGIDDHWLLIKMNVERKKPSTKLSLLFIGTIDKNKNLVTVLKLLKQLNESGVEAVLNVAGKGPLLDKYIKYTKKRNLENKVMFHGNLLKEDLIKLADQSDIFILPSFKETFGVSYIEAMSRGLPILYTKNEGIDGYFSEGSVGYSIEPNDVEEMKQKLFLSLKNYKQISKRCLSESRKFKWSDIANSYLELYVKAMNGR